MGKQSRRKGSRRPQAPPAERTSAPAAIPSRSPSRLLGALLFAIALGLVAGVRSLPMWLATDPARAPFTYEANGTTYPYVAGQDSYSWVRKARNYLAAGTACDVETADGCRDLLRHAPVGSSMPYAESLHIRAIAWLHRLLAVFDPGRPLEASAAWVQVVVGCLGVVASWLAGVRLGGPWAGFLAAIFVGTHPAFLQRSLGADNDPWNVVLPLCATAAMLVALDDDRPPRRRIAAAAAAAAFIGLHAAIWSGWGLGFVALLAGVIGAVAWSALRDWHGATGSDTRTLVLAGACFVGLSIGLTAFHSTGWNELARNVGEAVRHATSASSAPAREPDASAAEFPKSMRYVGELVVLDPEAVGERLGGATVVFAGLVGLLLLVVPAATAGRFEATVVAAGAVMVAAALWAKAPPALVALAVAAPLALLLVRATREPDAPRSRLRGAIVVAVWLAAALFQSLRAQRFILLAVAPLGLALAGGAGSAIELVRRRVHVRAAVWLMVAVVLVPVGLVARSGVEQARTMLPTLNDAWWDSLRELRATAPPDAIVHAWWSYGYWIEYGAERGVTADGSSLRTRIPHWLGRALMAPDGDQAVGLLRMLSCGSDTWPEAEGARGAYERLRSAGAGGIDAYELVLAMASLDRAAAERLLDARGYDATTRAGILEAMHCAPPPAYLMLSDYPLGQGDIRYQGNWDPRRAAVAHRLRSLPEAEAIAAGVAELGLTEAEARTMYERVHGLRTEDALEQFIAPMTSYFTDWLPCRAEGASTLVCDVTYSRGRLLGFTYSVSGGSTPQGMLRLREGTRSIERVPEALLVVDEVGVREVPQAGTPEPDYAVLIDPRRSRVLFGPPYLLRSVLARLWKLDGRGLRGFEKVGERRAGGERVTTWRIVWPPA